MGTYPKDPEGDMVPILEASINAAMELTAQDRCDSCSARAEFRVAIVGTSNMLDYCVHHWTRHRAAMLAQGWTVVIGKNPAPEGIPS